MAPGLPAEYLPPPVTPDRMAQGLTEDNLATAVAVRSMPEERRVLDARYRCGGCGEPLVMAAEHWTEHPTSGGTRHLHLLAFKCPKCAAEGGMIFDVTAAVALIPGADAGETVSKDEERRAAELGAYYLLDKAQEIRSDAARRTLLVGLRALGPASIGALRYSLRDVNNLVASVAATVLAEMGDSTDLRRLMALKAQAPDTPGLDDAVKVLKGRLAEQAREADLVWRPGAI